MDEYICRSVNLLLCFFVLLFSMSTVDAEKFEKMVASFQNTFSILPNGGSSIGDGTLMIIRCEPA